MIVWHLFEFKKKKFMCGTIKKLWREYLAEGKSFIRGCEFAISFLLEAGGFEIHTAVK